MRCHRCGAQWNKTDAAASSMNTCPFCGAAPDPAGLDGKALSIEDVLKTIVSRRGPEILLDGTCSLAMFSDLAPDLRKEKIMFSYLIQCSGNAALLDALTKSRPQQIAARGLVIRQLMDNTLLPETLAVQVCDSFWAAIGGQAFDPAPVPVAVPNALTFEAKCAAIRLRVQDRMIACGYRFLAALDVSGRVHVTEKMPTRFARLKTGRTSWPSPPVLTCSQV